MEPVTPAQQSPPPPAAERALSVALLLTASGGFLDAFTFVGHGHVFANAMTGNVVFLAVFIASAQRRSALRPVPSILAFLLGVFLAQLVRRPKSRMPLLRPALACLSLEIFVLMIVSLLPRSFPDMILVPAIALVAAMQNSSFTHLESWVYNSVMTTGNLRRFAESLFNGTMLGRNMDALRQARVFGVICLCFFAGAAVGAFATARFHNSALWCPIAVLCVALYLCRERSTADRQP
jgi:uncharacterized membrane protein YoaK (UPF0700 family)